MTLGDFLGGELCKNQKMLGSVSIPVLGHWAINSTQQSRYNLGGGKIPCDLTINFQLPTLYDGRSNWMGFWEISASLDNA